MAEHNPYETPRSAVSDVVDPAAVELAGRGQRFMAALVDGIIGLGFAWPIMSAFGIWEYTKRGAAAPLGVTIAVMAFTMAAYVLVHGYFLKTNGQTVGKKVLGIRIVDLENRLTPLWRLLALRYLPLALVSGLPILNMLVFIDALFIFRSDRRCVHDFIAGTKVVRVASA